MPEKKQYVDPNTGMPVQSWARKQFQLSKRFHCELCSLDIFGPKALQQHFSTHAHQAHLKDVLGDGVTDMHAFDGLLLKNEVAALFAKMKEEQ